MKITDIDYLKNNNTDIGVVKYKNSDVWQKNGQEMPSNIMLKCTSNEIYVPKIRRGYIANITGNNPYTCIVYKENDTVDLPDSMYLLFAYNNDDVYSQNSSLLSIDYICDTSNVTNMGAMFRKCSALTTLDLSSFNTSNVTDMSSMFYQCNNLISLDLSSFDTSNVTRMDKMFNDCSALTSLDVRNFDTSNVTSIFRMFDDCASLTELRLDNCSNNTINKIITSSSFPTFTDGSIHTIYCKRTNASGLTPPQGWTFSYVD